MKKVTIEQVFSVEEIANAVYNTSKDDWDFENNEDCITNTEDVLRKLGVKFKSIASSGVVVKF